MILNHIVYHEIMHLRQMNLCVPSTHDEQFQEWMSKHPLDSRIKGIEDELTVLRLKM